MKLKNFNLFIGRKIGTYKKSIKVDSDKSISIRFFLIGSISHNISSAKNILVSEDVLSTIKCLKKLGVKINKRKKQYFIYGKGLGSLSVKKNTKLNFGNSGTLARLLIGILSSTPNIQVHLSGDHSLNKRNMKELIFLMSKFGASFYPTNKFTFPLKMISSEMPIGVYYNAGVSAQLKSAVILAGLNSYGTTKILEREKSRDHTENLLLKNKSVIKIKSSKNRTIEIYGKKKLKKTIINIPGDPSSAAFFAALTLLNNKSYLNMRSICLNPKRLGFFKLLKNQGAKIQFRNLKKNNNEIFGDIIVQNCKLKPFRASKNYYTIMTDEYPILFVMAALIKGVSVFKGIKDLSNKESDRVKEMQKVLGQINIRSKVSKNEFKIYGQGLIDASHKKISVPNLGDHRICMSSFVLALLTGAKTSIKNFETVFTSSPSFLKIMKSLWSKFVIQK